MVRNPYFQKIISYLAVLSFILAATIGVTFYFFDTANIALEKKIKIQSTKLNALVEDVEFLQEQQVLFVKYSGKFQELIEQGLAKEQDRVLWADVMLKEKQRLMLSSLQMQFESQQPLNPVNFSNLTSSTDIIFQTNVDINGSQKVDTDFFTILYDIRKYITPFYLVKSCTVNSLRPENNISKLIAKFDKERSNYGFTCSLAVFNSKPKKLEGLK